MIVLLFVFKLSILNLKVCTTNRSILHCKQHNVENMLPRKHRVLRNFVKLGWKRRRRVMIVSTWVQDEHVMGMLIVLNGCGWGGVFILLHMCVIRNVRYNRWRCKMQINFTKIYCYFLSRNYKWTTAHAYGQWLQNFIS